MNLKIYFTNIVLKQKIQILDLKYHYFSSKYNIKIRFDIYKQLIKLQQYKYP